jgi:hypothetical protein
MFHIDYFSAKIRSERNRLQAFLVQSRLLFTLVEILTIIIRLNMGRLMGVTAQTVQSPFVSYVQISSKSVSSRDNMYVAGTSVDAKEVDEVLKNQ